MGINCTISRGGKSYGAIEYPEGSGSYWTPHNYASGAMGPRENQTATMEAAWYDMNSGSKTQPVGNKPVFGNGLGIFDMSGNVFEWVYARYSNAVIARGGSWRHNSYWVIIGDAFYEVPVYRSNSHGFRIARTSTSGDNFSSAFQMNYYSGL